MRTLKVAGLLAFTSLIRGNISVILLTVLILVLVALNLLFVPSLLGGLVQGANDKLINTYTGNIIVESNGDEPLLKDVDRLIPRIESIDGVIAVTARNSLGAELAFDNIRTNCTVQGIYPERESRIFQIADSLVEGSYLAPGELDSILLGIQLAGADRPDIEMYTRSLRKVHASDKISVRFTNGVEKQYTVKGIFRAEFIQTDVQAFVTEKELRTVKPVLKDRASTIHVKVANGVDIGIVAQQISRIKDGLKILPWQDYAGIVRSLTDSFNIINTILNLVNLAVAGITVFIVTYIDVNSRRRQIGIQRAIGITPLSITLSYLIRAIFYAVVGIVIADRLFKYVVTPLEALHPFYFPFGAVYLSVEPWYVTRVALVLLSVSVIAAFIPVQRVIRTRILDAIWR